MMQLARRASLVVVLLLLASVGTASVMDTKAAGRCVALGAMSQDYQAKAEAILDAANRTGYRALVNQRVKEEFAFLASRKSDKAATDAWAMQAGLACRQF